MCSETQTEKTSHFFPLFLEHLRQEEEEEEAHPRPGSSTTFTLPQVLTNYTVRLSFLQPEEQEAAGDCTASAWHDGCHTRCRYGSEIVPISVSHLSSPVHLWLWEESPKGEAFRTQPSAEEQLPGADQERKAPDMGTELGPGSKARLAAWFGHLTLLQPQKWGCSSLE